MQQFLHKLRRFILDGIFPAYCLGCKAEGGFLCLNCQKSIPRLAEQVCPWCYQPGESGKTCALCAPGSTGEHFLDGLIAAGEFEKNSLLQKAVHQLKYDFVEELALPLAEILFEAVKTLIEKNPEKNFVFCPLPLHPKRQKWRGFNQAELLCSIVVLRLHREGFWNAENHQLLRRVHFSKPQMELKREERMKNVREAFETADDVCPWSDATVILVDDIATTLSTLNSAACALKKAGCKEVWGLVLARVF